MTGSPAPANTQLDRRASARKASPPQPVVGRADGDRHLKIGHLIADRNRVATAGAPAGVGDQGKPPTRQPMRRRADQQLTSGLMARFRMAKPLCPVATGRGYCAFTIRSRARDTRDQRSPSACFHTLLDPEQHPPFHQEVPHLHEQPVCHGTHAARDAAGGDQAGSVPPKRLEGETASSGRRGRVLTKPPSMHASATRPGRPRPRAVPSRAGRRRGCALPSQRRTSSSGGTSGARARRWSRCA